MHLFIWTLSTDHDLIEIILRISILFSNYGLFILVYQQLGVLYFNFPSVSFHIVVTHSSQFLHKLYWFVMKYTLEIKKKKIKHNFKIFSYRNGEKMLKIFKWLILSLERHLENRRVLRKLVYMFLIFCLDTYI